MASISWMILLATTLLPPIQAATITYDFDIGWVTANPDGAFERRTIGINGQWPLPRISGDVGDTIIVNVRNLLETQPTSLHFHGLFMNGTSHMDGPSRVSQCPIPPGSSFTYNFTLAQPGTYWYHSHNQGQYPDGIRGPLIVNDPQMPFRAQYDEEVVLTLSDWYHDQMTDLIPQFMSKGNPSGAEPVPQAALLNDTQNLRVRVRPGTTYLFRVVNMAAFAAQYLWFEGHNMTIVEVDGVYTQPAEASMIYLSAAQRYSFLMTTRNDTGENFAIVGSMDTELFDVLPPDLNYNVTGWLVYDEALPLPEPATVDAFEPFDDMTLVPFDQAELLPAPDRVVNLGVVMDNLADGANYAFFNNITYKAPTVPTLYTALSAGDLATHPAVYGTHTHSIVLARGEVVQIVLDNLDPGRHPFHLHGHNFQAIYRSEPDAGVFADAGVTEADFPRTPMRRDTLVVWPNGNIVLRFRADNPGVWLFHCHIEWHVASGLVATFIEAPLDLQRRLTIPKNHLDACTAGGFPTRGNVVGNTENLLDLTGENAPPGRLPDGFLPRGIVALVFSCLAGLIGVGVVVWYGTSAVDIDEGTPQGQQPVEGQSVLVAQSPEYNKKLEGSVEAVESGGDVRE